MRSYSTPGVVNTKKGRFMEIQALTEKIEKISQQYARKFNIKRDLPWFVLKLQEEMGELIQSYLMMSGQARTKEKSASEIKANFEHEIVDVLCHTLLLARHTGIDLEKNLHEKWLKYDNNS